MQITSRAIERPGSKTGRTDKPVIITWGQYNDKPVKMLRSHSINNCVSEILEFNKRRQFLKINLIGSSGSGKTSLMKLLSHQLHSKSDINYEVRFFKDEDLANFKSTVTNLSSNPLILCFDDLSGLVENHGKAALQRLKAELTTVRHINDLEDRRIIMMMSFHSQKMLDKQIRISNFAFYTDCELEEIGYLEELLGKQHKQKISYFQRLKAYAAMKHKFSYPVGRRNVFTYKDGEPFQPVLYSNGLSVRHVVTPLLEWVLKDEICQTCTPAMKSLETKINLDDFVNDYSKKFGKGIAKRAVELKLLSVGIDTQPKRVLQARDYIERFLRQKQINLEELADAYNLKERATKLMPDKQPEFKEVTA